MGRRIPIVVIAIVAVILAAFNDSLRRMGSLTDVVAEFSPHLGWGEAMRIAFESRGVEWCCTVSETPEESPTRAPVADTGDPGRLLVGLPPVVASLDLPIVPGWEVSVSDALPRNLKDRPPLPPPRRGRG